MAAHRAGDHIIYVGEVRVLRRRARAGPSSTTAAATAAGRGGARHDARPWSSPSASTWPGTSSTATSRRAAGDKRCLYWRDEAYTYREVQAQSNRFGNALRVLGVGVEDRVLHRPARPARSSPSPGSARPRSGAVIAMVNPLLPAEDFAHYFEYTRAKVAVVDESTLDRIEPLRDSLPLPAPPGGGRRARAATSPSRRPARRAGTASRTRTPTATTPRSGSSPAAPRASPRRAVHLQQDLPWNTERYAKQVMGIREDDLTVSVPKLFFGYATGTNLLFPFAVGAATALFSERSEPGRAVRRHRALQADHPHLRAHHDQRRC